jgi:hypothetical protein
MTETEIAWAAGLFEGEGSMVIRPTKAEKVQQRFPYVVISLGMCDQDVVERFAELMGYGRVHHYPRSIANPKHKDIWYWQVARRSDCKRIVEMFLPYLGERRSARAREILAAASVPDGRATHISRKYHRAA